MSKLALIKTLLIASILLSASFAAHASHMLGGDLYYKWIGGHKYVVTLTIYGDCSGGAFPTLATSIPEIELWKDGTNDTVYNLRPDTPAVPRSGSEVTPLCPGYEDSSTCKNGTIPGITMFRWRDTIDLAHWGSTSTNWVFKFNGNLASSSAGRSGSITNLSSGGTMVLADTLDNSNGEHSSPIFTTIPTPFFCLNDSDHYNPGGVDPDGDSLTFGLMPGLDISGFVTYATGYSATNPLAVSTGSMSFDLKTGQLSFVPNAIQRSLVVEIVRKYHNGVLVGTSMREMTFVVIPCSSKPPTVGISNPTAGISLTSTHLRLCQQDTLTFSLNPVNLDSNDIIVTVSGLPAGATFNVQNNTSKHPKGIFSWNLSKTAPGSYIFYLSLQDNACPVPSKATQAITVEVLPSPKPVVVKTLDATCQTLGEFYIAPGIPHNTPWYAEIYKAGTFIDSFTTTSDTVYKKENADLINKYTVHISCYKSCNTDTSVMVKGPQSLKTNGITVKDAICYKYKDGRIALDISGGYQPLRYNIDGGPFQLSSVFDSIFAGNHTIIVKDTTDCQELMNIRVNQPDRIKYTTSMVPNECMGQDVNGIARIDVRGGTPPYTYYWSSPIWNTNNVSLGNELAGRPNGDYFVRVIDTHGCTDSATISITYNDCCIPYVPSAFTPNGDGHNDYFRPVWKGDVKVLNFSIYDRFGRRIYWSNMQDKGWDGTLYGQQQDMGTYYYYIKIQCGNLSHAVLEFKGDLTLIR